MASMNPIVTTYDGATGQTVTREMTDAEYAELLEEQASAPQLPQATDETPSAD